MIRNRQELLEGAAPESRRLREDILTIIEHVLEHVSPVRMVRDHLRLEGSGLTISDMDGRSATFDLGRFERIYVVGGGKAALGMAAAVEEILGDRISAGHVNVPYGAPVGSGLPMRVTFSEAGHPHPDEAGVRGSQRIAEIARGASQKDLVIALISGGGSALMPLPAAGLTLDDKRETARLLLKKNATIDELNVVRKQLSRIKGGRLALLAYPATVIGLCISDVVGDDLSTVSSGPISPDTATPADALAILERHGVLDKIPEAVRHFLQTRKDEDGGNVAGHPVFDRTFPFLLGSHRTSLQAAAAKAIELGYHTLPLTASLRGEAREVAKVLVAIAREAQRPGGPVATPAMILAAGETTVNVTGNGQGGRNQELALSASLELPDGAVLASFGTDGVDGFSESPVSGAIVDWTLRQRTSEQQIVESLRSNDSWGFFARHGGHIVTGPTGTNVGDLILLGVL